MASTAVDNVAAPRDPQPDATIEEVTVTVTRGHNALFEAPHSLSVIPQRELAEKLVRSLPEALAETPGILVQKTANGHGSPFLRGFTGYRTLALIDGVRYNNSVYRDGPNEYFSLIDFQTLQRVELLNGPASVLYGSDAIGGTLNLHTKAADFAGREAGEGYFEARQAWRYASAENSRVLRSELELGFGGQLGLLVGYSLKNFGNVEAADIGTLPHTGYRERGADARLDMPLNENWDITLVHQRLAQDDVWRTHSTQFSRSFAGTQVGTDQRRLKDQRRSLDYLKLRGRQLNAWWDNAQLTLSRQAWDEDGERVRDDRRNQIEFFDSRMLGAELQFHSHANFRDWSRGGPAPADFIFGLDYYRDRVDSGRRDFNADGSLKAVRIQGPVGDDARFTVAGAYVQGIFHPTDELTLTAASRYTTTHAEVGRFEDPISGLPATYRDNWNSVVHMLRLNRTFRLDAGGRIKNLSGTDLDAGKAPAGRWPRTADINLWGGISQSFRTPNIADVSRFGKSRSNETEVAATNLEPEKFLTYETGVKAQRQALSLSATYYYTRIDDFIASTPTGRIIDGLIEVTKQNSSSGFVEGIELSADYELAPNLVLSSSINWLHGELDTFRPELGTSPREPISRLMPLTTHLDLRWQSGDERRWASLGISRVEKADRLSPADRSDSERIPPGGTPGYTLVHLRGGCRIHDWLQLNIGLENLLDEAYRSHGSGSNEPGFGVRLGVELRI